MGRTFFLSRRRDCGNTARLVARSSGRRGNGGDFIGVLTDLWLAFVRSNLARHVVYRFRASRSFVFNFRTGFPPFLTPKRTGKCFAERRAKLNLPF